MRELEKKLNCIFVLCLCFIILGAFIYQFMLKEAPCPLCLLQRLGMVSIICAGLLNVKFGAKAKYYALALLGALTGAAVSIRQILLHIVPGSAPFGDPIFSLSLYTWALITFIVAIVGIAALLFIHEPQKQKSAKIKMDFLSKVTFVAAITIVSANLIYTLYHCGLGPCSD